MTPIRKLSIVLVITQSICHMAFRLSLVSISQELELELEPTDQLPSLRLYSSSLSLREQSLATRDYQLPTYRMAVVDRGSHDSVAQLQLLSHCRRIRRYLQLTIVCHHHKVDSLARLERSDRDRELCETTPPESGSMTTHMRILQLKMAYYTQCVNECAQQNIKKFTESNWDNFVTQTCAL